MRNAKDVLEFSKIQNFISEFAKTEKGRSDAFLIEPYLNKEALSEEYSFLKEVSEALHLKGSFPIDFSANLLPKIEHAIKGGVLTIDDLDHVACDILTSQSTHRFLLGLPDNFPKLKKLSENFIDLSNLERSIHRVITKSLTIDDKASDELFSIRKRMHRAEQSLIKEINESVSKYKNFLVEPSSTIRDGHFVLPVKSNDKHKVKGIVHDLSDTKQTTFIEPEEIVSLNNELVTLKLEEKNEIQKILTRLTNLVVLDKDSVINNNFLISKIDLWIAKVLYGNSNDSIFPTFSDNLEIISARHPLIKKDRCVANSFLLEGKTILLITGPNAGGKTVCLKTVGIISYMFLSGLMLPCKEAKIPFFKHIYVDIGDSQSLSDSLSTFSAHISSISDIVRLSKKDDLVLIDELGTGTDPKEGEALALAIIKEFEKKQTKCLISSHFSYLKEYALESKNVMNGSMIFDEEKLSPTYIFKQGLPGESYALEVAERYGIKKEVIDEAKKHLKKDASINYEELAKSLRKQTLELERQKDVLLKEKENFDKRKKQLESEENLLKKRRENLLKDVKEEKERILDEAKAAVDDVLKQIINKDLKPHELSKMKQSISDLYDDNGEEKEIFDEKININDFVSVPSLDIKGTVISISNNFATINSDGFSFKVSLEKLHKIEKEETNRKIEDSYDVKLPSVKPELNIIGLYVSEAKEQLLRYLDSALARNMKQVRIIHGFGQGKLRNMVKEVLSKNENVASFRLGESHEGGGGATVVFFK